MTRAQKASTQVNTRQKNVCTNLQVPKIRKNKIIKIFN